MKIRYGFENEGWGAPFGVELAKRKFFPDLKHKEGSKIPGVYKSGNDTVVVSCRAIYHTTRKNTSPLLNSGGTDIEVS